MSSPEKDLPSFNINFISSVQNTHPINSPETNTSSAEKINQKNENLATQIEIFSYKLDPIILEKYEKILRENIRSINLLKANVSNENELENSLKQKYNLDTPIIEINFKFITDYENIKVKINEFLKLFGEISSFDYENNANSIYVYYKYYFSALFAYKHLIQLLPKNNIKLNIDKAKIKNDDYIENSFLNKYKDENKEKLDEDINQFITFLTENYKNDKNINLNNKKNKSNLNESDENINNNLIKDNKENIREQNSINSNKNNIENKEKISEKKNQSNNPMNMMNPFVGTPIVYVPVINYSFAFPFYYPTFNYNNYNYNISTKPKNNSEIKTNISVCSNNNSNNKKSGSNKNNEKNSLSSKKSQSFSAPKNEKKSSDSNKINGSSFDSIVSFKEKALSLQKLNNFLQNNKPISNFNDPTLSVNNGIEFENNLSNNNKQNNNNNNRINNIINNYLSSQKISTTNFNQDVIDFNKLTLDTKNTVHFQTTSSRNYFYKYVCNYLVQIENDDGFMVTKRIIGKNGCFLKKILHESCIKYGDYSTKIRLRGKGSGYTEKNNMENNEPLMLCVSSLNYPTYYNCCLLVDNLMNKIYIDYHQYLLKMLPKELQYSIVKKELVKNEFVVDRVKNSYDYYYNNYNYYNDENDESENYQNY